MNKIIFDNKEMLKEALFEIILENKNDFKEIFSEIIEEIGLIEAIKNGETTKDVPKEAIMKLLNQ